MVAVPPSSAMGALGVFTKRPSTSARPRWFSAPKTARPLHLTALDRGHTRPDHTWSPRATQDHSQFRGLSHHQEDRELLCSPKPRVTCWYPTPCPTLRMQNAARCVRALSTGRAFKPGCAILPHGGTCTQALLSEIGKIYIN